MNGLFRLEQDKNTLDKLLSNTPVLPNVVAKMLVLDKDSDDYYEEVLSLASEDPFIAAKIIHLANSAAHAGRSKIETLTQAVIRVGVNQVSTLITSISLVKSFKPTQQSHRNLWLRALQVALISTKIAQLNQANSEQAYLSGLLHEIGRFILMTSDVDKFNSLPEELVTTSPKLIAHEMETFGFNSIDVTINTLKTWQIPDAISNAITGHLLSIITDSPNRAEYFSSTPGIETPSNNSVVLETILSTANTLSGIILENPELESLDETEIEALIRDALAQNTNDLFLPPLALAKVLPLINRDAKELAVSLGVS
jgi:HD-like signal output (HDOD) protein